ncbi:hypothetical protein [Burkholderia cepacia]|uniref:hypothetical protein n=1 Tax=Burkholderia cepacia TaxID=292 RepID=UPI001CF34946|nr:hypothetical protein [Burkholderia cepacia]MCA8324065.1 hypothetical protein [Burkholderia cepacia]
MSSNQLTDARRIEIINKATQAWGRKDNDLLYLEVCEAIEREVAATRTSQPAAAPIDVEARFVAEHGHRLAQLLRIDAFDIADRDAQIMAALSGDAAPSPADERAVEPWPQKNEYFAAWLAICNTLEEVAPEWHHGEECGMDKACRAIRAMATKIKDLSSDVRHIYGAYGDACARAAYANETGAEGALGYAQRLAVGLWEKHYRDSAPQWKVLDDTLGVLTQIDNMVCGLSRSTAMAAEASQPVCWIERSQLEQLEDLTSDAWVYWRETGHVAEADEVALYAAPQPAQADARVGLTEQQREILQACVDVMLHRGVPTDNDHPERVALDRAQAILQGGGHADSHA